MSFFLGIAFDDATRAQVARALDLARPKGPDLKWENEGKAHLTLLFLAENRPDEKVIAPIAAKHAAFSLALKGAGEFNQRILWLGIGGQLDALDALQADLQAALGTHDEHGEYAPHVTLARARRGQRLPTQALSAFEAPAFQVTRVTLF